MLTRPRKPHSATGVANARGCHKYSSAHTVGNSLYTTTSWTCIDKSQVKCLQVLTRCHMVLNAGLSITFSSQFPARHPTWSLTCLPYLLSHLFSHTRVTATSSCQRYLRDSSTPHSHVLCRPGALRKAIVWEMRYVKVHQHWKPG
jgi:hypothetical protein